MMILGALTLIEIPLLGSLMSGAHVISFEPMTP